MNTIEGIEGETNIQNHGDEDTTVLTAETDISVEKIEQVTEVLNKENESLIDIDKMKGLIKDEVELLKFKAYELTKGIKDITLSKAGKIASTTALGFVLASCASPKVVMAVPQEMTERAEQRQTQTQEAFIPTPTSEATLSPEEIREKRLNEIAEVVKENNNSFTTEEISKYLTKHGTWGDGQLEEEIEYYDGHTLVTFQYYIVENDYQDSGIVLSDVPYQFSQERTMYEKNSFPCPKMVDEREVSRALESIYVDLWIKENGKYTGYFIERDGGYQTVIYMTQETGEDGKQHDVMFLDIGGFFFADSKGNIKYISLDKIINKQLTDEEMELFTDTVLTGIKEGWIMFVTKEDGNLEKRSNFGKFKELLRPATSSDIVAQEIN